MQSIRNDKEQFIDIWLKREEPIPSLTAIHQHFPNHKITIFRSGQDDLAQSTAALLRSNLFGGLARV